MPPQKVVPESDPWAEAAKGFKAEPQSESAPSGANDDWKIWQAQEGDDGHAQPGFLENLGHAFGIGSEEDAQRQAHPVMSAIEGSQPPVALAHALFSGGKRIAGEVGQAAHDLGSGNPAAAAVHGISAIPVLGPALMKMSDEAPASKPGESYLHKVWDAVTPGNLGTGLGTASQVAPAVLGGADLAAPGRPLVGELPSTAKAGKVFETVMGKAQDEPVWMRDSGDELVRARELMQRGGGRSTPVTALDKRVGNVNQPPMTYREARDYASNLSRLSADEGQKLTPSMRRQVGKLSHAFNSDVGDAATRAGVGDQYVQAMRDYARGARLEHGVDLVKKWAIPALGTAVVGGTGASLIRKAMQ